MVTVIPLPCISNARENTINAESKTEKTSKNNKATTFFA